MKNIHNNYLMVKPASKIEFFALEQRFKHANVHASDFDIVNEFLRQVSGSITVYQEIDFNPSKSSFLQRTGYPMSGFIFIKNIYLKMNRVFCRPDHFIKQIKVRTAPFN